MKYNVFVHGTAVAVLESTAGFEHALTYLPTAQPHEFVSLAMPVQTASWTWPALHPFFQVSLPEGFLLSVLKEQLGPHLGASGLDLLSVVGHNLIGRVQVSAGVQPNASTALDDLAPLLHGEASEQWLTTITLLLTFALGNADCHTKNLAFIYDDFDDVEVAPIYDMLTVLAYDRYANNPPGMYLDGRKSWSAVKALWRYLQSNLGIDPPRQRDLVDRVCTGVASTVPELLHHIQHTPGFAQVGARMLWEWNEGMKRLSERRTFALADWVAQAETSGLPRPTPAPRFAHERVGE